MLSDIYLQITLFPPYGFTVSFLCCLWQYFLSCRRQAQGSEISVLQIGAHPQGEAAFIFAIWLPFLHQLISSCLFVQLLCTAQSRKKPYGRGAAAFLHLSWGSWSLPAISFLLHSTDCSQEKKQTNTQLKFHCRTKRGKQKDFIYIKNEALQCFYC